MNKVNVHSKSKTIQVIIKKTKENIIQAKSQNEINVKFLHDSIDLKKSENEEKIQ